ncbi:MAG TPA: hypothetical protein VGI70_17635, partial [Polyangiales bacterium]
MEAPRQQRAIEGSRADERPRSASRRRKRAPLTAAAKTRTKALVAKKNSAKSAKKRVARSIAKKAAKPAKKKVARSVAKKSTQPAKKKVARPIAKKSAKTSVEKSNAKKPAKASTRAAHEASAPAKQKAETSARSRRNSPTPISPPLTAAGTLEGLAFRLDPHITPQAYRLHIRVDPSTHDDYVGEVAIELRLERPRSELELHAADLTVDSASVELDGDTSELEIEAKPDRETIALQSTRELPEGTLTLRLSFRSTLRSDLRGFYAAKSGQRRYAFTQLEAADARRFFPCFDEPAKKARFRISVTTGSNNRVVSNNPIERVEQRGPDEKTVHFSETPPLSSYLVALAVGELSESSPVYAGGIPIR